MSFIPKPHEIYKHFKGNLYQVTAIAEHTETGEQLVVYQALYGDFRTYARPLDMFVSRIDREKYPDAAQEFRFELQGPEAGRQIEESMEMEQPGMSVKKEEVPAADTGSEELLEKHTGDSAFGMAKTEQEEVPNLDPLVLEFLDADNYGEQLNILAGLHHRITDDMINTMAVACDIEINEGDIEERYEALKTCLLTLERYECNRLR